MLSLDTPIATPSGWTTMGDLQPGDQVFDERGEVCSVVAVHPVDLAPESYRMRFDDGSEIDACADHRWLTFDQKELMALTRLDDGWRARRRAKRVSRVSGNKSAAFTASLTLRNRENPPAVKPPPTGTVRTTGEIAATLTTSQGDTNHAVPVAGPLKLPDVVLPIDPYLTGLWLGDGTTRRAEITSADSEVLDSFRAAGFEVASRERYSKYTWGINGGFLVALRENDLLGNKHVPEVYLRGSIQQRLSILQGLMDTDGCSCESGAVEFTSTKLQLAEGVRELVVSLGGKVRICEGRATLYGRDCGAKYRLKWTTALPVFRLERKLARQKRDGLRRTTRFRYIVGCERIGAKPMRCITVDSQSGLYLAGKAMIPTHNTDLLLGLAGTRHHRSIIFRRVFPSMRSIIERSREIYNGANASHAKDSFNESLHVWRLSSGAMVEFGSIQHEKDLEKYRGRPHDFYGFDEVTEFTENQVRFVTAWNRSTKPGQRCRWVATGNPPTSAEGQWVIRYWAPWLDNKHPNPAKPGELRWFARIEDKDVEVSNGKPFEFKGETIQPRSRTFIPARLSDNPILEATGYRAVLQGMPEPLRSQMLYGDFTVGIEDNRWQVIPTEWVRMAQARWTPKPPSGQPLTSIGVDVARGGRDATVLAKRYARWFAQLIKVPGVQTRDGPSVAALVVQEHEGNAVVNVDVIGVGSSVFDCLKEHEKLTVFPINNAEASKIFDRSGKYRLVNVRAASWWKFREALDPENGDDIALPPDNELLADLCAPRFKLTPAGIVVEPKEDVIKRLGRSPDCGDAVVMAAWLDGLTEIAIPESTGLVGRMPEGVWAQEGDYRRGRDGEEYRELW